MTWYLILLTVLCCVSALALIVVVLLQDSSDGLSGAISGNRDSYMARNGSASKQRILKLATRCVSVVFMLSVLLLYLFQ